MKKIIVLTGVLMMLSLTACSGPTDEADNKALLESVKQPLEKAQEVEKTLQDAAARQREAIENQ